MLVNISNTLCVSKHSALQHAKWICYEPCTDLNNKKRQTWKRVTGLMSECGMHTWLSEQYPESGHASMFLSIANR